MNSDEQRSDSHEPAILTADTHLHKHAWCQYAQATALPAQ